MKEWDGTLADKVTDAELDAAATELRGTLEVMLSHADDKESAATGAAPSAAVWRPRKRPAPTCFLCGEIVDGVYAIGGQLAHTDCVTYQAVARRG